MDDDSLGPYFGGWIYANYGRTHLFLLSAACYGMNIMLNVLFFEESSQPIRCGSGGLVRKTIAQLSLSTQKTTRQNCQ